VEDRNAVFPDHPLRRLGSGRQSNTGVRVLALFLLSQGTPTGSGARMSGRSLEAGMEWIEIVRLLGAPQDVQALRTAFARISTDYHPNQRAEKDPGHASRCVRN